MTWFKITCAERDQLMATRDLVPISSCTDLDGEFHSEPQMDITWGTRDSTPVLRETRYPPRYYPDDDPAVRKPDRKSCEHYRYEGQADE